MPNPGRPGKSQTARHCSRRCAQLLASDWMRLCPTSAFPRLPPSRIIRSKTDNFATNAESVFLVQQLLPVPGEGSNIIVILFGQAHAVVVETRSGQTPVLAYACLDQRALETLVKYWPPFPAAGHPRKRVAPGAIDTDMSNFTKTEAGRAGDLACRR